ncbi:MAG: NYN domain-containing protein [Candidatus Cohnella colombiensis]|uniref:NYN domain-containing protein n=1 Tax=Candidatus Cohnella colombiensis TaxID=3121368 RepID=A0AA95JA03_9BACL|nr:MAG: NYN domain-containing protein [Cohnella sp.]
MRSFVSAMQKREEVLLVDGYNIIGAWPELVKLKNMRLELARDRLLELLSDYQSYSGAKVIVVFDAFSVPGLGAEYRHQKLKVVYTRERETADECIERLVGEWTSVRRHIYVATSDLVEQNVVFGRGALRISARELKLKVDQSRNDIQAAIRQETVSKRNPVSAALDPVLQERLEQMRRGIHNSVSKDGQK